MSHCRVRELGCGSAEVRHVPAAGISGNPNPVLKRSGHGRTIGYEQDASSVPQSF